MPPEVVKFLHDIEQACSLVERFTAGKRVEDYRGNLPILHRQIRQFIGRGVSELDRQ